MIAITVLLIMLERYHPAWLILWHPATPIVDWTPHTSTVLR